MNNTVIHINNQEIDRKQWDILLKRSLTVSFFQTPGCYGFYKSLSFLQPFVFGISENNELKGLVCGYIIADGGPIKRYFSRRAIIPGGVLLAEDISEEALRKLLQTVIQELKKKAIYIEIRNYNDYTTYKPIFESAGFCYNQHLNYQIQLNSQDNVFKNLSGSKQRQIKQAQKEGIYWEEAKDQSDINKFYVILSRLYKTRIKRPLFPLEFFQKLVSLPHGSLLVVKKENQVLGGMACVLLDDKVLYEWFVCGDETVEKKYYASVMATWAGIEYAVQNGIEKFDFMGAGKPNEDYGVREFKSKFGGDLVENGRFLCVSNRFLFNMGKSYLLLSDGKKNSGEIKNLNYRNANYRNAGCDN